MLSSFNQVHPLQTTSSGSPSAPAWDGDSSPTDPPPYSAAAAESSSSFPDAPTVSGSSHGGADGASSSSSSAERPSSTPPQYETRLPAGHRSHPSYTVRPSLLNQIAGLQSPLTEQQQQQYPPPPPPYAIFSQQYQSVTVDSRTSVYDSTEPDADYGCAICLACFVMCCCGCIVGFIAFILAAAATNVAPTSRKRARSLAVASYVVSGIGIALPVVITCSILVDRQQPGCSSPFLYSVDGTCFKYRLNYLSPNGCTYVGGHYAEGFCYHNYQLLQLSRRGSNT